MKILRTGGKECFKDLPIEINWDLTKMCNYRCSYCFNYGKGKTPPPNVPFSTLDQLKTAVDNIASLNRPWYDVTLSGGEPTVHPHIFDLIGMLYKKLGKRLNRILIITNGSRNESLYGRIADIAKEITVNLLISIHTDHVEMEHILKLIENLSGDINMNFSLMFNPAKRDFVHEIFDSMFDYRKRYWFNMNVVTLRDGDRVDPRYTPEDFAWQKQAVKKFNDLVKRVAPGFPDRRKLRHSIKVIHDIEDNSKLKTLQAGNRTLELADGLLKFTGMYCIAYAGILRINANGRYMGMVCGDDHTIGNIYEEKSLLNFRDKLIHPVRCTKRVCGCAANDRIPKFAFEEDAKKYLEFAQKRQAELFDEYIAAQEG